MVEGYPAVIPDAIIQQLVLLLNRLQRKIIIGHDPEGIRMAMGGAQIPRVNGRFSPRRNLHQLMTAGVSSGMADCDTWTQFSITCNQPITTSLPQKIKILGKIRGFGTTSRIAQILPFHTLEDMRRPGKGQLPLSPELNISMPPA